MKNRLPSALLAVASIGLLALACDSGGDDGGESGDLHPRVDSALMLAGDAQAGATVYANSCSLAACHGADGVSGDGADLSAGVPALGDELLLDVMLKGGETMPPLTALTDQQLADVLAYLNETF